MHNHVWVYFLFLFFSVAERYMLQLLEYQKQQLNKLMAMVSSLPGRTTNECPAELPEDIQFPFASIDDVQNFEDWLKAPHNRSQRKNLV